MRRCNTGLCYFLFLPDCWKTQRRMRELLRLVLTPGLGKARWHRLGLEAPMLSFALLLGLRKVRTRNNNYLMP